MEPKNSYTLITGAASGLGWEFMQQVIKSGNDRGRVIGVDKDWSAPHVSNENMSQERSLAPDVEMIKRDLSVESEVLSLVAMLESQKIAIDCLIHCAGVRGLVPTQAINGPRDVAKAEDLSTMDKNTLISTFQVNVWASFSLLRALIPVLNRSSSLYGKQPTVMIMGSRMGSMGYNTVVEGRNSGGGYAYRASKAALNAIVRSLSIDVPDVKWLIVHPGRVETKLVSVKEDGAISPRESVLDMMRLFHRPELLTGPAKFIDRFGDEIPW